MTDLLMRIDINILAFLVLGVMWLIAIRQQDRNDLLSRIFIYMIIVTMVELVIEAATFVIDGSSGLLAIIVSYTLNILLFSSGPVLMMLWCLFLDFWVFRDTKRIRKKAFIITFPIAINALIVISAPLNGLIFSITNSNIYHRGPAFFLPVVSSYFLIFYSIIFTIINRANMKKDEFIILIFFALPSVIGGGLQAFNYGILLLWSTSAFTLAIMYIYLQQKMTQVDSLTGAWTRGTLDRYLDRRISRSVKSGGFGAIMIDLDNFKSINDAFGHTEGDRALRNVVCILKSALRKEDVVARYGGDEFVILLEMSLNSDVEKIIERIEQSFDNWNAMPGIHYILEYSSGYSVYIPESALTMDEFLFRVDSLMYASKYERKKKRMQLV